MGSATEPPTAIAIEGNTEMKNNQAAFHAMVLKSMELKQPLYYTDDLHVWDRIVLGLGQIPEAMSTWEVVDGHPFVWIARDSGTELIYIGSPTDSNEGNALINLATLSYYERGGGGGHDSNHYFWGDGTGPELIEIELKEARGLLNRAFQRTGTCRPRKGFDPSNLLEVAHANLD